MKTTAEFDAFYTATILPKLQPLEEERLSACRTCENASKEAWKRFFNHLRPLAGIILVGSFLMALLPGMPWFIAPFALLIFLNPFIFGWIIISGVLAFIYYRSARYDSVDKFRSDFKRIIVAEIAAYMGANYKPKEKIRMDVWNEGMLFCPRFDTYRGEDLITGRFGDTPVMISELSIYEDTTNSEGSGGFSFFGLFLVADFNKHFSSITYVLPQGERDLPPLVEDKKQGYQKVTMDNPEFALEFDVYSNNSVEAYYILSTSLMERMMAYQMRMGRHTRYAFRGTNLFIAASGAGNLLEPKLHKTLLDKEVIYLYYEQLSMLLAVVEDLNLNTRIWSKQSA